MNQLLMTQSRHERFFNLVCPDDSLKLHAFTLREFASPHSDFICFYKNIIPLTPQQNITRVLYKN